MKVIKLAGLWKKKDAKGNLLLTGGLNEMSRVLVMKNTSKKGRGDPDYFLCIGPRNQKDQQDNSDAIMGGAGSKSLH